MLLVCIDKDTVLIFLYLNNSTHRNPQRNGIWNRDVCARESQRARGKNERDSAREEERESKWEVGESKQIRKILCEESKRASKRQERKKREIDLPELLFWLSTETSSRLGTVRTDPILSQSHHVCLRLSKTIWFWVKPSYKHTDTKKNRDALCFG